MNLKEIQRTLMDMYERPLNDGKHRHIVFWYDEAGEFKGDIHNLELDGIRIWEVTPNNLFATKYELEKNDKASHFLIYGNMAKPASREDWLLDVYKYSFEFATDKVTVIMRDLGVDNDGLRELFKKYTKFFNNKERYNLFASYKLEEFNEQTVTIAILSALCKRTYVSLEEVLKVLFEEERNESNKYWDNIVKFGDVEAFWTLVEKVFGYVHSDKSLQGLFTFFCITDVAESLKGNIPATWKPFVASNLTNSVVFMDHFMNKREAYTALSDEVAKKIDVNKYMSEWELKDYAACDTFRIFDVVLIDTLASYLAEDLQDYESYKGMINQRRKSYWYNEYRYELGALYWAIQLLQKVKDLEQTIAYSEAEDMFKTYYNEYHFIDKCYRKFYAALDKAKEVQALYSVRDVIENVYTNWYVNELALQWSKALENNGVNQWELHGIEQQHQFYTNYIRNHVNKNERVFVIISDALRYEAAKDLCDLLNVDRKGSTEISAMQSVLPSYTDLGMASLLPHRELALVGKDVHIDGLRASSTENRNTVLNKYVSDSIAVTYEEIADWNRQKYRDMFTGKKVIYIYHNTIDAHGDQSATERKVFDAVDSALKELLALVNNLVNQVSASQIYITADHGFLYQRSVLENHDKVLNDSQEPIINKRRFLVSKQPEHTQGTLSFSMDYVLGADCGYYVTVPRGAERFPKQGSGANYVHGGSMLQEVVVPLIKFKNDRSKNSKNEIKKVGVQLTSITRKITNSITYLDFFQTEAVGDKKIPLRLKVYITDEVGDRVSNENIIIGDKRSEDAEDRMFKEKFVLKSISYDKTKRYYLVMEDEEESVENIVERIPFTIDITFTNDFGF
ncbi:BREX-1 system phosphatase PglZ type A [Bacillus sp. N447-1]|uniref:BREX-1 system phosphatase PglZ type A n=1 Tax=Bacillus TaxID=1386 RepID=UPI001F6100B6|nr:MULTISPECIES: BREX-1 system phosphatase PglZ type A [Bacillus]MDA2145831.1 BREX-1 system phosphatase PglZ type A [Bacillus cereus group sp. Bc248]MDA2173681.1 BREX-1 system phosphatase PglZ type A [Bacillus cereus group sp. Bc247]UNT70182.1 BREX-1 system phosphatase PglZ type A [Bacillus sp. N447-1]HDR4425392.1 BREX-1 system phosphatase PglZ type A [Bacillus cereus]